MGTRPQGLTQAEATERLQRFGRNVIRKVKGKPLWLKFLTNFTHLMAILLWIGGIVGFSPKWHSWASLSGWSTSSEATFILDRSGG
jgi:magnesium-transporting ATPase (P-type)